MPHVLHTGAVRLIYTDLFAPFPCIARAPLTSACFAWMRITMLAVLGRACAQRSHEWTLGPVSGAAWLDGLRACAATGGTRRRRSVAAGGGGHSALSGGRAPLAGAGVSIFVESSKRCAVSGRRRDHGRVSLQHSAGPDLCANTTSPSAAPWAGLQAPDFPRKRGCWTLRDHALKLPAS